MQSPFGWRSKRRRSTDQVGSIATEIGTGVRFEGTMLGEGNYHHRMTIEPDYRSVLRKVTASQPV